MGIDNSKGDVAKEVSGNRLPGLDELVELARDKSTQSRSRLATVIGDLYLGQERLLSEHDRELMSEILHEIILEVEISVRKALSERLSGIPDAPPGLIRTLANDEIEVAHPILVHSEVMHDSELIEVVQFRTMEHQMAVAMRPTLSERVSDALVATGNEEVITTLLDNPGATISESNMTSLVEQAPAVPSYQEPLSKRQDLSPALARKLYWSVSAALREHIVAHYEIDPGELDEKLEVTVKSLLGDVPANTDSASQKGGAGSFAAEEHELKWLSKLLNQGDIPAFMQLFSKLSRLRATLVRRILFEPGGEGLAIACKAIGVDRPCFAEMLIKFRQGRLGDKRIETDEVTRAMAFFDRMSIENATALLRRWQRDPEYLNALRIVHDAGKTS